METTYSSRLKRARLHAKLSQAELGRRVKVKPQTIQYLENKSKNASGSSKTVAIARECGINPDWLATGSGSMLGHETPPSAQQERANYDDLSNEAIDLARIWARLPENRRRVFRDQMFFEGVVSNLFPWLTAAQPTSESYAEFEARVERDMLKKRETEPKAR